MVVAVGTGGFNDPNVELIWGDHANPFPSDVYMRKTFVLGDTIPSLELDHGEDDDANVYVNGTLVSSDQNTFAGPTIYNVDITPYLVANATNVIAVKATDTYCCGYLFALRVHPPSCPAPTNLSVTNIASTSATLNWDVVENAQGYKVRYKVAHTKEWVEDASVSNSIYITGLLPGTEYQCQVQTYCQADSSQETSWSPKEAFTTSVLNISGASLQQLQQSALRIFPNPAKDHVTVQFTLPQSSHVYIKVYDVSGKEMRTLFNGNLAAGSHSLQFNTDHFSKGVYIVKMISDGGSENQKLVVE